MKKPLNPNSFHKNGMTIVVIVFLTFLFTGQSKDLAFVNQNIKQKLQLVNTNVPSEELVIIGHSFDNKISLKASLPVEVMLLEVSYSDELLTQLNNALDNNPNITNIHLFSKTNESAIELGNDILNGDTLETYTDVLEDISAHQGGNDLNLFVYSCSLSDNANGLSFLSRLANKTKFNVLSATNCNSIRDEGFVFDYSSANKVVPMPALFH